tara:strand:+ start:5245 stop:5814 length:570 start_codon:yes stop_codon:yes gene_type:complete
MKKVGINQFARRQIKGSGKTYSDQLSFEEIAEHAEKQILNGKYKNGYRDGVIIVSVSNELIKNFVCPFVKIKNNTKLFANFVRRSPGEDPYIQICALNGKLLITGKVNLVLYSNEVLKENKENSTNCEWELISILSIPKGINEIPMGPVTMMRNQLNLKGGTKGNYSSADWAKSVKFWQNYAVLKSLIN